MTVKSKNGCFYLDGTNIAPKYTGAARKLIGKHIKYLRKSDIDRSGRGLFFPRFGKITGVWGRNLKIDEDFVNFTNLIEMIEVVEEEK